MSLLVRTASGVVIVGGLWLFYKFQELHAAWMADRAEDKRLKEEYGLDDDFGGYDIVEEDDLTGDLVIESETPYDTNDEFWAFGGFDNWALIPDCFDDFTLSVGHARSLATAMSWRYPARTGDYALRIQNARAEMAFDEDGNAVPYLKRPRATPENPLPDFEEKDTVFFWTPNNPDANPVGYAQYLLALEGPAGWATKASAAYVNDNSSENLTQAEYLFSLYLKHVGVRIFTDKLAAFRWLWVNSSLWDQAIFPRSQLGNKFSVKRPYEPFVQERWASMEGFFFPCWKDNMEPVPPYGESGMSKWVA